MQNLKNLFINAKAQLQTILDDAIDFRFEQYQYDEKNEKTEIVISFLLKKDSKSLIENSVTSLLSLPYDRQYKQVNFNSNNEIEKILIFDK